MEDKTQLGEYQETLNVMCELFEKNIQFSLLKIATKNGEVALDDNKFQTFMNSEENESARQDAFRVYANRASNCILQNKAYDNSGPIVKIANARLKMANLFGYKNYWSYSLVTKAFSETEKIRDFLEKILSIS